MRAWIVGIVAAFVAMWSAHGKLRAADAFADWHNGDLVLQQSTSPQSNAIRAATGSRYTHLGIVRITRDRPVVVEAARTVSETPLRTFVSRGSGGHFSVYRVRNLSPDAAVRVMAAARQLYGRPYDLFFRPDATQIYCSELPVLAFAAVGIRLGRQERFGDLNVGHPAVRALFAARWQQHPDCRAATMNAAGCWRLMQDQKIVTPVSLTKDPQLERIYSSFPDAHD
jgi:hypothetical protein